MLTKNKIKKDLISILDFSKEEICNLLQSAKKLKSDRTLQSKSLTGKTLAMIFQKPSTRTSVSFAAGMVQLGGFPLILNPQDLQMKRGESIEDTAKIMSRFVDGIMIRANKHEDVLDLGKHSTIPIINGLTDKEHPCQVLADLLTIYEQKNLTEPSDLKNIKLTYLGDGNNMAHSLMLAAALLGMEMVVSSPKNYEPEKEYLQKSLTIAKTSGAKISIINDPMSAVANADILYTDVWASMGKDEEREHRKQIFMPYQINISLLPFANPDAQIMHCLPAHRGEEITEEIIDGPRSIVLDQAENRLHIQKAILLYLLADIL